MPNAARGRLKGANNYISLESSLKLYVLENIVWQRARGLC